LKLVIALLLAASLSVSVQAAETIQVTVSQWVADRYDTILAQQQTDLLDITDLSVDRATQQFVNLVIIKQALHKGGISVDFDFVVSPNSRRAFSLLRNNKAVLMPMLIFKNAIPNDLLSSSPLITSNNLLKGIYGLKSNKSLMAVTNLTQLQQHSAVTKADWKQDISILKQLNLKSVDTVNQYITIYKRIAFRNTDFTLLDFPFNKQNMQQSGEIKLYPVPNLAIELKGSKHFVFSKSHPDSKRLLQAFEKGLVIMKKDGLIQKYYQQAKIIRTDLSHLNVINKKFSVKN